MNLFSFEKNSNSVIESHLSDVYREMQNDQDESEILISWIQLFFALLILTSWIFSIMWRATKPEYEIVPFILAPYILFSIAKITWAKKRLVNDAVLMMSAVLDIFLVTLS